MNALHLRKASALVSSLLILCSLSGCTDTGEGELRQWMSEERARARPKAMPLKEPSKYTPEQYTEDVAMDPFDRLKLLQALRKESAQLASNAALIAPEMERRKEPLESYPLDNMQMVGSMNKAGKPTALIRVGKLLYQVQPGNYLGQNYGKVMEITETTITLREIVQDPTGDWVERVATLELQEGAKP